MMQLPFTLKAKIIDFLQSLPAVHSTESQQAFIYRAGLDSQLFEQVAFGKPSVEFCPLLLSLLWGYGKLHDGRYALESVLEVGKDYVGEEGRAYCNAILEELAAIRRKGRRIEIDGEFLILYEEVIQRNIQQSLPLLVKSHEDESRGVGKTHIEKLARSLGLYL